MRENAATINSQALPPYPSSLLRRNEIEYPLDRKSAIGRFKDSQRRNIGRHLEGGVDVHHHIHLILEWRTSKGGESGKGSVHTPFSIEKKGCAYVVLAATNPLSALERPAIVIYTKAPPWLTLSAS